ncbi:MAG: M48 family metalloprotease, partial [Bacillota bacterium]
ILKGMLVGALGSFAALFLLNSLVNRSGLAGDFRVIPLALLFLLLLSLAAAPAQNALSRVFERQADGAALALTNDPAVFISLKQNIAGTNLATVRPHPYIKYALYTHPPVMERIEHARDFQRSNS